MFVFHLFIYTRICSLCIANYQQRKHYKSGSKYKYINILLCLQKKNSIWMNRTVLCVMSIFVWIIVMPHWMKRVMKQRESTLLEFLRIIICDGAVYVIANAFHTKNEAQKVIVCIRTLARTHAFYYRGKALC